MKNRQLMYIPDINPSTFLFFYFKGDSGRSYSFREYPASGGVIVKRAGDFSYNVDEILENAVFTFDAPTHPTDDEAFWRDEIQRHNNMYRDEIRERKKGADGDMQGTPSPMIEVNSKEIAERPDKALVLPEEFILQNKDGIAIDSVRKWLEFAPPKMGKRHWKDGRSAKELAKAWLASGEAQIPQPLVEILESNEITAGFEPKLAIPEYVTDLDNFRGEGRNHDMILIGFSKGKKILVSIEAKADEPFGEEIYKIKDDNSNTMRFERRDMLLAALFEQRYKHDLKKLRYQLVTGVAGALIEAKNQNAEYAVFIVHEFNSKDLNAKKVRANTKDLEKFIIALSNDPAFFVHDGELVEIDEVPGGEFVPDDIPLMIGKIKSELK